MKILGRHIRSLRRQREWSCQKLADLAGVSRMTVFRIEQGKTTGVRLDTLEAIAKVLDVTVKDLLADDEPKRPRQRRGVEVG